MRRALGQFEHAHNILLKNSLAEKPCLFNSPRTLPCTVRCGAPRLIFLVFCGRKLRQGKEGSPLTTSFLCKSTQQTYGFIRMLILLHPKCQALIAQNPEFFANFSDFPELTPISAQKRYRLYTTTISVLLGSPSPRLRRIKIRV